MVQKQEQERLIEAGMSSWPIVAPDRVPVSGNQRRRRNGRGAGPVGQSSSGRVLCSGLPSISHFRTESAVTRAGHWPGQEGFTGRRVHMAMALYWPGGLHWPLACSHWPRGKGYLSFVESFDQDVLVKCLLIGFCYMCWSSN